MSTPKFTERPVSPRAGASAGTRPADQGRGQGEGQDAGPSGEKKKPVEVGGPGGPDPTRYGDWELKGRCIDF